MGARLFVTAHRFVFYDVRVVTLIYPRLGRFDENQLLDAHRAERNRILGNVLQHLE